MKTDDVIDHTVDRCVLEQDMLPWKWCMHTLPNIDFFYFWLENSIIFGRILERWKDTLVIITEGQSIILGQVALISV